MTTDLKLLRLIDANLNRLREGLRVIEDICRFVGDNEELSKKAKSLRHTARCENYLDLLQARDTITDCSKSSTSSEMERSTIHEVVLANIKRAQESARVLEESFKLLSHDESGRFKSLRYELYTFEQQLFSSLQP